MNQIERLLDANAGYAAAIANVGNSTPGRRRLAVVTCMDARIDVFAVLGLHLGEAHVVRNAGGRVTDDVVRSLALSVPRARGRHGRRDAAHQVRARRRHRRGAPRRTGADLGFFPIDDHAAALREDIDLLSAHEVLRQLTTIVGFVYDVENGELDDVVRWNREL